MSRVIVPALNTLSVSPLASQSEINEAYHALLLLFPDDGTYINQGIRAILESANRALAHYFGQAPHNYREEPDLLDNYKNVLTTCSQLSVAIETELRGCWLWIIGDIRDPEELAKLRKAKCIFHPGHRSWYFRPEFPKSKSRGRFSEPEIKAAYGVLPLFDGRRRNIDEEEEEVLLVDESKEKQEGTPASEEDTKIDLSKENED